MKRVAGKRRKSAAATNRKRAVEGSFEPQIEALLSNSLAAGTVKPEQLEEASAFAIEVATDEFLKTLNRTAKAHLAHSRAEDRGFQRRNFKRWKAGFDELEKLCEAASELGSDFNEEFRPAAAKTQDYMFEALTSLHARAVLVTREIICLLKGGFPDGALARWRSLHEIAATGAFIRETGPETALRYLAAERAHTYRAMCQLQEHAVRAGMEPFRQEDMDAAKGIYDAILAQFGPSIRHDYGWASVVLGRDKPTFLAIEKHTGLDHWRPRYRWASRHTHANYRPGLSLLAAAEARSPVMVVGPSNSGFTDPAHMTAISLTQSTTDLLLSKPNLDRAIFSKTLLQMSREVGRVFWKIDRATWRSRHLGSKKRRSN